MSLAKWMAKAKSMGSAASGTARNALESVPDSVKSGAGVAAGFIGVNALTKALAKKKQRDEDEDV